MIEIASRDDVPRILELAIEEHAESRYASYPFDSNKMRTLFEALIDGAGVILLCRTEGVTVGMAVLQIGELYFGPTRFAFDYGIYVTVQHRGSFAGAALIRRAKQWAREQGAEYMDLGIITGITEDRSGAFYEAMGAKCVGALYSFELGS